MSSLLDLTLVVQLVHFACAYWILSKVFFKPAYRHSMKIRNDQKMLLQRVAKQEEALKIERSEKSAFFQTIQKEIRTSELCPSPIPTTSVGGHSGAPVSPEIKSHIISEITQILKKRILHE